MCNLKQKAMKYRVMVIVSIVASLPIFGVAGLSSAPKASAHSEKPEVKQISQESVYTIQTGSFKNRQRAEMQFSFIKQSLEGAAVQALRIEQIGGIYAVRVGTFASPAEAEQFLRRHQLSLKGSMVMKAHIIDERILLIHDGEEEFVLVSRAIMQRDRYLPDLPYARNDLGLRLVGTALVDEPEHNIAIIENLASGDQEIYKKGDMLQGVLIKRILSRKIVIDEGRGDEVLIMVRGKQTETVQSEPQMVELGEKKVDADESDDDEARDEDTGEGDEDKDDTDKEE